MSTETQSTDEQHFVRLVLEASFATADAAGSAPENTEDAPAHFANWYRLMRAHDPRLATLDDQTLSRLLNTPMDDDDDDNDDDDNDDDNDRASSPENPAKRITKDSLRWLLICARCWVRDKLEEYETGESSAENIVDAMLELLELLKEAEAKEEAERLARAGDQAA
jgi:hypothetical protein